MTTEETPLSDIARRHGVSVEAAREVLRALQSGGGRLAQFNHPDLGGYGQWMPGMVMIGRMGDDALKARVAALCTELAALPPLAGGAVSGTHEDRINPAPTEEGRTSMEPMKPMQPMRPMEPLKPMEPLFKGGDRWWPGELGEPGSAGGQNDLRYAYFPGKRRLVVSRGGKVEFYDTGEHEIGGVSQQQSGGAGGAGGADPVFTSQHGRVELS